MDTVNGEQGQPYFDTITFKPATVEFDGMEFERSFGMGVPFLWLAYHARRGDEIAIELLTKFQVKIVANGGKNYWPIEQDRLPVVTGGVYTPS